MVPWTTTPAGPRWTRDRDKVTRSPVHGARLLRRAGARHGSTWGKRGPRGTSPLAKGGSTGAERGRRRVAVAAAVEARRGWCSSRGGCKLRVGITAGYGVGAHSAFYKAAARWSFKAQRFRQ
jgi:hypothetical protein